MQFLPYREIMYEFDKTIISSVSRDGSSLRTYDPLDGCVYTLVRLFAPLFQEATVTLRAASATDHVSRSSFAPRCAQSRLRPLVAIVWLC